MSEWEWSEDGPSDEYDEYLEETAEEVEEDREMAREVTESAPEQDWLRDLLEIANDELRQRHIERADHLFEAKAQLEAKLEAGEITQDEFDAKYEFGLRRKLANARTAASMAAVGITGDHLGDISEDHDLLIKSAASGETRTLKQKERVMETVEKLGVEAAQKLADDLAEEDEMGPEAHDLISRQARLKRYPGTE